MNRRQFVAALLASLLVPATASAHLATFGSWEITRKYLGELFPEADDFLVKRKELTDAQVKAIESELGFHLYPEDKTPAFYIAVKKAGGKRKVLGVAIFIDPRVTSELTNTVTRLEVGIGVDTKGKVHAVKIFDYKGNLKLTQPDFLKQLQGRTMKSSFKMGMDGLKPVEGEEKESQLVANAAYEALYLMKVSLGK